MIKKLLTPILILISVSTFAQSKIGYELRTNNKSYIAFSYKGLELRHRTDLKENRFTYRHNMEVGKNVVFSVPLHYKVEKNQPTLEPRLVYKFEKFKVWVQKEFNHNELMNTAIAVDIPLNGFEYRLGWDDSKTFRFRIMRKF